MEEEMWVELTKTLCVMVNAIEELRIKAGVRFDSLEFDRIYQDLNSKVRHIEAMEEEERGYDN